MWYCSGPCEQGRKPCPCPMSCNVSELTAYDRVWVWGVLTIAIVALSSLVAWGVSVLFSSS